MWRPSCSTSVIFSEVLMDAISVVCLDLDLDLSLALGSAGPARGHCSPGELGGGSWCLTGGPDLTQREHPVRNCLTNPRRFAVDSTTTTKNQVVSMPIRCRCRFDHHFLLSTIHPQPQSPLFTGEPQDLTSSKSSIGGPFCFRVDALAEPASGWCPSTPHLPIDISNDTV